MKKKLITIAAVLVLSAAASAQKVYQSGAFWGQALRPGSETITGTLVEKYFNKGYYWFKVDVKGSPVMISIVKTVQFDHAKQDSAVVVPECFQIENNKWKRKLKNNER